jgi:hypothetical protein
MVNPQSEGVPRSGPPKKMKGKSPVFELSQYPFSKKAIILGFIVQVTPNKHRHSLRGSIQFFSL